MTMPLSARFAWRDLRGGLKGFRIFLACLTLGVTAIAGVGSLGSAIRAGIDSNARNLLGADIEVRMSSRAADKAQVKWMADHSEALSLVRQLRTMARMPNDGNQTLVELKAVATTGDAAYPLYGMATLDPEITLAEALANKNGVRGAVAEPALLARLGAKVGDRLTLGTLQVELRATLVTEPDRVTGTFALGPRLMINNQTLDAAGLVQQGSLVRHNYRMRLARDAGPDQVKQWRDAINKAFPDSAWRIADVKTAQPSVKRFVDRLGLFLTLVGLTALVIGGVGVGNAVQAYLAGRTDTIATLKCLGAEGALIFRIYLIEIGLLALLGIAGGLVLGAALPMIALGVLEGQLPVAADISVYPVPLLRAAAFGVLTAFAFALWPLARAREVPAAGLFRDIIGGERRWPPLRDILLLAISAVLLIVLALTTGDNATLARWFIAASVASLLAFWILARAMIWLLARMPRPRRPGLRLALSNLVRPGAPTAGVVISMGAGLTVLVTIALIEGNLDRQVQSRIPDRAPSFFFIDIQPDQVDRFEKIVSETKGGELLQRVPMLRGRVAMINGVSADTIPVEKNGAWFAHNELAFSYMAEMPEDTELVSGAWWAKDYQGPPLISLGSHVGEELNIKVGDTITFNILGRKMQAKVANLRKIDWTKMRLNFSTIFAPGALESAPQVHIATASAPKALETTLRDAVSKSLPNVSAIRVGDVLDTVTAMFDRISSAIRASAAVTVIAGILVLAGALAAGHSRRVYDSVILKVLGATRRDIARAYLIEYALLGGSTAVLATFVGTTAAWTVMTFFMAGEWVFLPLAAALTAGGGIVMTIALGFIGTWRALGQKAATVLRHV
jgi:putative ABC transport system permease protein